MNIDDIVYLLDDLKFKESSGQFDFEKCLKRKFDNLVFYPSHLKYEIVDQYSTVCTWSKIYDKRKPLLQEGTNGILNTSIVNSHDEFEVSYKLFIEGNLLSLNDISDWNGRKRPLAWVFPYKDLIEMLAKFREDDFVKRTEYIITSLGLENGYYEPDPNKLARYVYIIYPEDFELPCKQPNSTCAIWSD